MAKIDVQTLLDAKGISEQEFSDMLDILRIIANRGKLRKQLRNLEDQSAQAISEIVSPYSQQIEELRKQIEDNEFDLQNSLFRG